MRRVEIDKIPDNWYEKNRIAFMQINSDISVLRIENRGGGLFGLIHYELDIHGMRIPATEKIFNTVFETGKYELKYQIEYKFLDENCNTYMVYEIGTKIYTDMP